MIGTNIGGHKIIEQLGEGGMGVVYKARQLSLSRMVAMKILPEQLTRDSSLVQRFFNEARAIAALNHPNIVQIFDVGKEGRNYYYTMELVDGISLEDIVQKREPMPIKRSVNIISSVAKALAYTHRRGIVHRDIKPSNIMIDKAGRIKLADFGLALRDKSMRLTSEGGLIGTPEFMSPEQASGRTATALSDIFSLGVVFYEMLTGRSPFEDETALAVLERIKSEEPEPPRSLNPEISPEIEGIIRKMMAKSPADRYQDCRELRADLKRFKTGESTAPSIATSSSPRRSRTSKAAILLVLLLAIGSVFFLVAKSKDQKKSGAAISASTPPPIASDDVATAEANMWTAKMETAAALIPLLVESERFPEIQRIATHEQNVIVTGSIEGSAGSEPLRRLSHVKLNMEKYCGTVESRREESVGDATEFEFELRCMSELLTRLGSESMLNRYPSSGRVWQMAEEKVRLGVQYQKKQDHESAAHEFDHAAALYAKSSQIAEIEREMMRLGQRINELQAEIKAVVSPDTVVLKGGERIECSVIEENVDSIRVKTAKGTINIPRRNIISIDRMTEDDLKRLSRLQTEIEATTTQKEEFRSELNELHLSSIRISSEDISF